jgi:hypothetical protein
MKNIAFVLWMVLDPIGTMLGRWIYFKMGEKVSENVAGLAAVINTIVYIYVATLLYEKP